MEDEFGEKSRQFLHQFGENQHINIFLQWFKILFAL